MNESGINSFEELMLLYFFAGYVIGWLWAVLEAGVVLGPVAEYGQRHARRLRIARWLVPLGAVHVAFALIALDASRTSSRGRRRGPLSSRCWSQPISCSIENPSGYDLRVELSVDDGSGWMPLGVAIQRCTTVFDLVIDLGSTWHIRFHAQGREAGRITVTRADLQRAGWTFQIPASVEAELARGQAPLPPVPGCATPPTR